MGIGALVQCGPANYGGPVFYFPAVDATAYQAR